MMVIVSIFNKTEKNIKPRTNSYLDLLLLPILIGIFEVPEVENTPLPEVLPSPILLQDMIRK